MGCRGALLKHVITASVLIVSLAAQTATGQRARGVRGSTGGARQRGTAALQKKVPTVSFVERLLR